MLQIREQSWDQWAASLSERISCSELEVEALRFLNDLPLESPLAIACSGGADSVLLTLLTFAHFPERREKITLLHFNHQLRGEASELDQALVQEIAGSLGLNLMVDCWERENRESQPSEAEAREARHQFFRDSLERLGGEVLLFGHQKDDIAETLLMRLARGSGTRGLSAPRAVQIHNPFNYKYLRPILTLPSAEIRRHLSEVGVPWREDDSNHEDSYLRNRLRHHVLPEWVSADPNRDVLSGVALSRKLLSEENEALEEWVTRLLPEDLEPGESINFSEFSDQPIAIIRRALQRFLHLNNLSENLKASAQEELLVSIQSGKPCKLSAGVEHFLVYQDFKLSILSENDPDPWSEGSLNIGVDLTLPDGATLNLEPVCIDNKMRKEILSGAYDPKGETFISVNALPINEKQLFQVRSWQPGDRYKPLGAPGSMKLQDLFVNKKISSRLRHRLPVICLPSGEIVWCPGLPPADQLKIDSQTDTALRLTYFPPSDK